MRKSIRYVQSVPSGMIPVLVVPAGARTKAVQLECPECGAHGAIHLSPSQTSDRDSVELDLRTFQRSERS